MGTLKRDVVDGALSVCYSQMLTLIAPMRILWAGWLPGFFYELDAFIVFVRKICFHKPKSLNVEAILSSSPSRMLAISDLIIAFSRSGLAPLGHYTASRFMPRGACLSTLGRLITGCETRDDAA
jgi:hypothetical protein